MALEAAAAAGTAVVAAAGTAAAAAYLTVCILVGEEPLGWRQLGPWWRQPLLQW